MMKKAAANDFHSANLYRGARPDYASKINPFMPLVPHRVTVHGVLWFHPLLRFFVVLEKMMPVLSISNFKLFAPFISVGITARAKICTFSVI